MPAGWPDATRYGSRGAVCTVDHFGHAHVLVRRTDGTLAAASDPRAGTADAQTF